MENPATWDVATRLIHETLRDCETAKQLGFCGTSRAKRVRDALAEAGLLREDDG